MKNERLYNCYKEMAKLLGPDAEPYESVELVEQYRKFWRPDDVRVVLLAESHVFTSNADREYKIRTIEGLPGYPSHFAKFVYCLAYGEDSLTEGNAQPAKDGTPQFWKVFYSCVNKIKSNASFAPVLKSGTETRLRIRNKVKLLKALRDNKVWLVDASIVALYDKGKKPSKKVMARAFRTSWSGYTKGVIQKANPDHVIVVGEGVAKILKRDLINLMGQSYSVIAQPNARLSAEQHLNNFKTYYRLCIGRQMIRDYYHNQFRADLATFMPDERVPYFGHSWDYDCRNLNKIPVELRPDVLVDQAMYTHYHRDYERFAQLTKYPKFCHGLGQFQKNPRELLIVPAEKGIVNKDAMAKELSTGMELFIDEVMDFFQNHMTHINPEDFFNKLVCDSDVQIPLIIVMINPEMKEDIGVQAYGALRTAVENKFGKKG